MSRTVDGIAMEILAEVVADFRNKKLGSNDLDEGYVGAPMAALKMKYCTNGSYPEVDFDLAFKQLEENKLIETGPLVPYENDPYSDLVICGLYSKREYVYLTEKGYKEAQKTAVKRKSPTPTVHISGGNFNQSPIGIGSTVNQDINFNNQNNLDELQRLVEVFEKHIDDLSLDVATKRKAMVQITTIKAQLEDEPDPVIVKQAGRTLRNITEGAIGSLIATATQPTVWSLVETIIKRLFS
jgi:hypothetical protein